MSDSHKIIQQIFNMNTNILISVPDKKVKEVIKVLQALGCKIDINSPYLDNIWRAEDVKQNHPELGDDDCLEVLDKVFSSDYINQEIFQSIDEIAEIYKEDI